MTLDYVCVTCRTIGDNQFDYVLGIRRLEKAAVTKSLFQLREAVQREMLFRANLLLPQEPVNNYPEVDPQAAYVIDNYVEGVSGNPRKTTGDGDCLFNAVSIVLKGDETLSTKLRYHTCLNLVNNMDRYMTHPLRPRIQHLSCSYESACLSAAKPGYSSAWTILALSDAISMPIKVLYPFANGKNDIAYQTLNTEFTHEQTRQSDGAVYVLWHKLDTVPSKNNWYQVNHFSAVTEVTILEIEHERQTNVASTPVNCSKQEETTVSPIGLSEVSDIEDKSFRSPRRKRRKMSINVSPVEEHDNGLKTKNRFEAFSENDSDDEILGDEETTHDSEKSMANSSLTNISVAVDDCDENISESLLKNLPNGRFWSNAEFFDALLHTEPQANRIPPGEKSNVYMVLKHAGSNCSRMDFVDDCGIWETGTTVNQYFVVTNNCVNNVYKKDGQFSLKKLKDKKLEFVPIYPQPEDVITLHRYYAKLKGEDYRRRVSVVTHASDRLQGLTMTYVVEYMGHISRKERPPHGNAKSSESYKRTERTSNVKHK